MSTHYIFLWRNKKTNNINIKCGYPLVSGAIASNEYPQQMFSWRNKKKYFTSDVPLIKNWVHTTDKRLGESDMMHGKRI